MGANLPQKYTEDISVMTFTEYAEFCPMSADFSLAYSMHCMALLCM